MESYYDQLSAEVYAIDKKIGHTFGDVEFYRDRLSGCTGKILEPGVGTGRILIPLLESGLDVDGLDMSAAMLAHCKENCKQRGLDARLFQGNMQSTTFKDTYDAIIIPTGTFLLLHQRNESTQALHNFYDHLNDGGRFIFDIFLQTKLNPGTVKTRTWETETGDIISLEEKLVTVDAVNQYTVSHNRYEKWRNGKLIQTELEQFPLRWYGVEEMKLLLQQVGFEIITISADYKQNQYPNAADQIITFEAVAVKSE